MDGLEELLPPLGHNQPPSPVDELRDRLAGATVDLLNRTTALHEAAARIPSVIPDEETAGRVSAFVAQINAHEKVVEKRQRDEKRPHDEAGKAVLAFFRPMFDTLGTAKKVANERLLAFQRERERQAAEARRRAEEEARRKAEEARRLEEAARTDADLAAAIAREEEARRAQQAAASVQAPAPIRSDYGAVSSIRRTVAFEVEHLDAVPRQFLMLNEAAVKAHAKLAKKGDLPPAIPGIRWFWHETMVSR